MALPTLSFFASEVKEVHARNGLFSRLFRLVFDESVALVPALDRVGAHGELAKGDGAKRLKETYEHLLSEVLVD